MEKKKHRRSTSLLPAHAVAVVEGVQVHEPLDWHSHEVEVVPEE